jgi:predicted nuclease of predicted toxin-antitoxin system
MKTCHPNYQRSSRHSFQGAYTFEIAVLGFSDEAIWDYARNHGFTIVSKDSDFYQRSVLYGHPPKLIWLRIGNCTRAELVTLVNKSQKEIHRFIADPIESVLALS